jgi:hypothetical protein
VSSTDVPATAAVRLAGHLEPRQGCPSLSGRPPSLSRARPLLRRRRLPLDGGSASPAIPSTRDFVGSALRDVGFASAAREAKPRFGPSQLGTKLVTKRVPSRATVSSRVHSKTATLQVFLGHQRVCCGVGCRSTDEGQRFESSRGRSTNCLQMRVLATQASIVGSSCPGWVGTSVGTKR